MRTATATWTQVAGLWWLTWDTAGRRIAKAVYDQILTFDYVHPTMFTGNPVEELAQNLARKAPAGIERFYLMTSGS